MTDIVERLRGLDRDAYDWFAVVDKAADEIERLRVELAVKGVAAFEVHEQDQAELERLSDEARMWRKCFEAAGHRLADAGREIERLTALVNAHKENSKGVYANGVAEIERLRNLIDGACEIFCQLDAPHWATEFRRALEPKP